MKLRCLICWIKGKQSLYQVRTGELERDANLRHLKNHHQKLFKKYFEDENKKLGKFKYECICLWSKDDKYGFIPNTSCPVHGKEARKVIKKSVSVDKVKNDKKEKRR